MGRDYHYKPGSYYRIDDRSGFRFRAERTKKEWNGLLVADRFWEARQPQDFVRGVADNQTVPDARIRPAFQFIGPAESTLSADALDNATFVSVNSPFPFKVGDRLGIMLTNYYGPTEGGGFSDGFSSGFETSDNLASFLEIDNIGVIFFCVVGQGSGGFSGGFSPGFQSYSLANLFIDPPLQGFAASGNVIFNMSTPQILPENYGSSSGG